MKRKVIVKTISWAVISGLLIFCTTFLTTFDLTAALWSACSASLIKTLLYGFHEVWFDKAWLFFTAAEELV